MLPENPSQTAIDPPQIRYFTDEMTAFSIILNATYPIQPSIVEDVLCPDSHPVLVAAMTEGWYKGVNPTSTEASHRCGQEMFP